MRNNILIIPETDICLFCGQWVVDGRDESGYTGLNPDWMTDNGDFGCDGNPITTREGCGGHWTRYDVVSLYVAHELDYQRRERT